MFRMLRSTGALYSMMFPQILILVVALQHHTAQSKSPNILNGSTIAQHIITNYGEILKDSYKHELEALQRFRAEQMPTLLKNDIACLDLLEHALQNPVSKSWTAKLLESRGKFGGIFSDTATSFGDFDSCISINENDRQFKQNVFGKYCFITERLPTSNLTGEAIDYEDKSIRYRAGQNWNSFIISRWLQTNERFPLAQAICVPSVCSPQLIRQLIISALFFPKHESLKVDVDYCQTNHGDTAGRTDGWSGKASSVHFALIVLSSAIMLTVFGTLINVYFFKTSSSGSPSIYRRVFNCFDITENAATLFNVTDQPKYPWIDGMRCFFTCIVLSSHVSVQQGVAQLAKLSAHAHYPDHIKKQTDTFLNLPVINSAYTIKFFFCVAGFLLSVNFMNKRQLHSFGRHVLNRWARFTPTILGYLAFSIILSVLGSGPLFHWKLIEPYVQPCFGNIWRQLTFTNNLGYFQKACGFHMWYISVDMQLYILAYPVLWLIARNMYKLAYSTILFMISLAYINTYINFYFFSGGFPVFVNVIYSQLPVTTEGFLTYWTRPLNHSEAYFFGIFVGILVGRNKNDGLSKKTINLIWTIVICLAPIQPFVFPWFYKNRETRSLWELYESTSVLDGVLHSLSHAILVLCFGWIFYSGAKHFGKGGQFAQLNGTLSFLSTPFARPFARLSYCVYLVHVPLTWFNIHTNRYPQMLNDFGMAQFILATYVQSLLAAILLNLLFETPFNKLVSLCFQQFDNRFRVKTSPEHRQTVPSSTHQTQLELFKIDGL